jgi:hypothetical protein
LLFVEPFWHNTKRQHVVLLPPEKTVMALPKLNAIGEERTRQA